MTPRDFSQCPTCGGRRIRVVKRDVRGNVRGHKYIAKDIEFHECPDCGEKLYGPEAMRKIESFRPRVAAKPVRRRKQRKATV